MKKLLLSIIMLAVTLHAEEIYATFQVEAEQSANLAFSSSGIVEKVTVDVGSVVVKNEILASLQNDDIKAMAESAEITANYAQKDFARQEKVKKVIDEAQFDRYAYKYESAKAQEAYQKALLDKTVLKAPFDGVIFEKSVEVGDTVSGAMLRTILKIQSRHQRKLIVSFDQKYHTRVKEGDSFSYKVDGDESLYSGTISRIYPAVDRENRKIVAEVKAKDLMVGLFGEGTITASGK